MGYNANKHWTGALAALVALRLADSPNIASGIAGVATLTAIGIANIPSGTNLHGATNYNL